MNRKTIILSVMAAVLAAGAATVPAAAQTLGDIDGSGKIDSADSLYILRMSVGLDPFSNAVPEITPEQIKEIEETIDLYGFEGVICAKKNGQTYYTFAQGTLENNEAVNIDSAMPAGSVSKQFCAAAVLLLSEKGKLSLDDKLNKYYPEYGEGSKVTLSQMLSMRSGIPEISDESAITVDKTEEENTAEIKKQVFTRPLDFEPGTNYEYTNTNYILLANIVEQVSGKKYSEYLRENFFEPLGMKHTGTIPELNGAYEWSKGMTVTQIDLQPGLTKGCGDVISNAGDMQTWMDALRSGKAISKESYRKMTTDPYSENYYGYGMFLNIDGGVGHPGMIGIYSAYDYINEDQGLTIYISSNSLYPPDITSFFSDLPFFTT